jgi:lysozyme
MSGPARRQVPRQALDLIRRFEGLHDGDKRTPHILEPQADPIGIYTVGWGQALFAGGRPVRDRDTALMIWRARWPGGFGLAQADQLLAATAQAVCDKVVGLMRGAPLSDGELGALVSLAYNIGVGEAGGAPDFADSSVRRRILAGDRRGAADAFRLWKYAGGEVLAGLVNRREAERAVFLAA